MKRRIIACLITMMLLSATMFAEDKVAVINGTVDSRAYALSVQYGDQIVKTENGVYEINKDTPWNLLEDGHTEVFSLIVNGNERDRQSFDVEVTPEPFSATVGTEVFVGPDVNLVNDQKSATNISAGLHEGTILAQFHFEWSGDTTLPAGDYTSDIKVTYSAV